MNKISQFKKKKILSAQTSNVSTTLKWYYILPKLKKKKEKEKKKKEAKMVWLKWILECEKK